MQNTNLQNSKQTLTKELIIEEYKNNNIDNFTELSHFKLVMFLLEEFPNIIISKKFPKYLLLDDFDLMLDIFAEWDYDMMTENDIAKIVNILEKAVDYNIDEYHIQNIIFAISTYAKKDQVKKFTELLKHKSQLLLLIDK